MENLFLESLATIDMFGRGLWTRGLRRQGRPLLVEGMNRNIMALISMLGRQVGTVKIEDSTVRGVGRLIRDQESCC